MGSVPITTSDDQEIDLSGRRDLNFNLFTIYVMRVLRSPKTNWRETGSIHAGRWFIPFCRWHSNALRTQINTTYSDPFIQQYAHHTRYPFIRINPMASDILAVPHAGSPRQAQLKVVSRKVLVEKTIQRLQMSNVSVKKANWIFYSLKSSIKLCGAYASNGTNPFVFFCFLHWVCAKLIIPETIGILKR